MRFFRTHCKLQLHMKLFLLLIITFMIPLVILSSIFIKSYADMTKSNVVSLVTDNHSELTAILNSTFESFEVAGNLLVVNEDLASCIECYQSGQLDKETCSTKIGEIVNQLSPYFNSYKPEIAIVDVDGSVLGGNYLKYYFEAPQLQEYLQSHLEKTTVLQSGTEWFLDSDLYGSSPLASKNIYGIHSLLRSDSKTPCGAIIFRIRKTSLISMVMPTAFDYQNTYLLTDNGDVILKYENVSLPEDVVSNYYDTVVKYSSSIETNISDKDILLQSNTLDSTNWHFVSFSDIDYALSSYTRVNTAYYAALLICALLSLILSYIFAHRFTRPILELHNQLKLVEQGNLFARVEIDSNDEIGELSKQFNHALIKIQQLMGQLVSEQEDKRKADMQALQAQINPHFIFNTLTSVRYLIYSDKRENADAIIVSLNKLMKYALSDSQTMVSINLEIEQLNNYLLIQKMSLGDTFSLLIDIDPAIGNCKIMKLLLQPLAENAILHGLKPKKGPQELCIRGYSSDNDIEFIISDNGVGFDLSHIPDYPKDKHSIGIANTDKRIKLHFGTDYGVRIESQIGEGTTVYVRIPKIANGEEYHAYDYFIG